jgi:acetoin utilization protein AcuB
MNVSDLMSRTLISVGQEDSVEAAVQLLRRRGVRHLLVMRKDRLVGIISDRDLKRALEPEKTKKKLLCVGGLFFLMEPILVREIMTPNPVTIGPDAAAQEAARIMVRERFGALPVEEDGKVVGMITETDLLRCFAQTGREQPARPSRTKKSPRKQKR